MQHTFVPFIECFIGKYLFCTMSLVCIYVRGSQFVLITSMLKFTGVLKQLCKQKLPMLNFFSSVFQLLLSCMIILSNGLVLFAFFNGLLAESEFLHCIVIIILCLLPNGLNSRGKFNCCVATERVSSNGVFHYLLQGHVFPLNGWHVSLYEFW